MATVQAPLEQRMPKERRQGVIIGTVGAGGAFAIPPYPSHDALRLVIPLGLMRKHTPDVASLTNSGAKPNIGRVSSHHQFQAQHVSSANRGTELSGGEANSPDRGRWPGFARAQL